MKLLQKLALAAALCSVATYASALTPIADSELSKVSGRDGVSIAADLKINIGDFTYTNTSANGGSVSFKNIGISGTFAATLDVISGASFFNPTTGGDAVTVLGLAATNDPVTVGKFYGGGDVVKIAIPNLAVGDTHKLNMSVEAISMGGSTASYGKMAMNDIKLQGSTVYIWAH
jgi:hypothetical protein